MNKIEARKKYKVYRKNIQNKEMLDKMIISNLENFLDDKNYSKISIFVSLEDEIQTFILINHLLEKKTVLVPKVIGEDMINVKIDSLNELEKGAFNVLEPSSTIEDIPSIIIVPGLTFSHSGNRLGYGKGYYDKYLSKYPNLTSIGLCYEECIDDSILYDQHDKTVDYIITEKRIIKIS